MKRIIIGILLLCFLAGCSSPDEIKSSQQSFSESSSEASATEPETKPKPAFSTWKEYIKNEMKDYVKSDADVTIGKTEEKRQVISVNIDDIKKDDLEDFLFTCYMLAISIGNYGDGSDALPPDIEHVIIYFPQGTLGIMYIKDNSDMYRQFPLGVTTTLSIKKDDEDELQKHYDNFFSLTDIMKGI